jgi:hypothetical protein
MKAQAISRTELNRAVEAFIRRGGLVVRLVPEKTRMICRVGQKWGQYEEVLASAGTLVDGPFAAKTHPK